MRRRSVGRYVRKPRCWLDSRIPGTATSSQATFDSDPTNWRAYSALGIRAEKLLGHLFGFANETERGIAADELLTKRQRRMVLMLYREATGRDALNVAALYQKPQP